MAAGESRQRFGLKRRGQVCRGGSGKDTQCTVGLGTVIISKEGANGNICE